MSYIEKEVEVKPEDFFGGSSRSAMPRCDVGTLIDSLQLITQLATFNWNLLKFIEKVLSYIFDYYGCAPNHI